MMFKKIEINTPRLKDAMRLNKITQKTICGYLGTEPTSFNKRLSDGRMSIRELTTICAIIDSDIDFIRGIVDDDFGFCKHKKEKSKETNSIFDLIDVDKFLNELIEKGDTRRIFDALIRNGIL